MYQISLTGIQKKSCRIFWYVVELSYICIVAVSGKVLLSYTKTLEHSMRTLVNIGIMAERRADREIKRSVVPMSMCDQS